MSVIRFTLEKSYEETYDEGLTLALSAAQGQSGGAQTYNEAVALAVAAGMSQASIGMLQETIILALAAGFTRTNLAEMMESIALAAGLDCSFLPTVRRPGKSKICFIFQKRRDHFRIYR